MEPRPAGEECVYRGCYLPLKDYLGFMTTEPVDAAAADPKALAAEWRAARDCLQELQRTEAAWADNPKIGPVTKAMEPLIPKVLADPVFHRAFSFVPVGIGLVELDRLVASQKTINRVHARRLQQQLGRDPDDEAVFRTCLPFERPPVDVRVGRVGGEQFVFVSESNDLRFLEAVVLRPEQVRGYQPLGPVAGVVGLVVGYGSNYLNVISCEGRLALNNGFHRAYALRDLGVTHAPCVVQKVSQREELSAIAGGGLRREPDVYFRQPRPPVVKDYFNPRLCKVVRLPPRARHVRVSFTTEEIDLP